ncbi:MAG: hypothetical protein EOP21_01720 [Hyphomicrobiales bacterium]|nr:MAG: hypothetical protein EOP21_01720 [Hyphomicrobiales bacterium]
MTATPSKLTEVISVVNFRVSCAGSILLAGKKNVSDCLSKGILTLFKVKLLMITAVSVVVYTGGTTGGSITGGSTGGIVVLAQPPIRIHKTAIRKLLLMFRNWNINVIIVLISLCSYKP